MGRLLLFFLLSCFGHDKASLFGAGFSPQAHHHRRPPSYGSAGAAAPYTSRLSTALFDKVSKKKKLLQQQAAAKHTLSLVPRVLEQIRQRGEPSLAGGKLQAYYQTLYANDDHEPTPLPDKSVKLLLYLDQAVPKVISPSDQERIRHYILTEFLRNYLAGARLRKLQRDIAFRMEFDYESHLLQYQQQQRRSNSSSSNAPRSKPTMTTVAEPTNNNKTRKGKDKKDPKMPLETIMTILGAMERDGLVHVRFAKKGKFVIERPVVQDSSSNSNNFPATRFWPPPGRIDMDDIDDEESYDDNDDRDVDRDYDDVEIFDEDDLDDE